MRGLMTIDLPALELIGAPTDVGASVRGAGMGPDALRVADLPGVLARLGFTVHDSGNLAGPATPWAPPQAGLRHLDEVVAWNRAVYEAVDGALGAGHLPLLLGGDHCLAIGSVSAIAWHVRQRRQKLRVIWFDAHTDVNTDATSPSGNIHGMPVACLCGLGPDALTGMAGFTPAITPDQIRQIGIRSVDPGEKRLVQQHGLDIYDMRYIDEVGMRRAIEEALEGVDADTHLHVSFDVDMLDPAIAPGTGTRVPGGVNYREAQLIMEMVADTGRMGSLDLVEVNPALDKRNATARLAVDLVESLFGKSTLMRD